jgi:hypothetical protein
MTHGSTLAILKDGRHRTMQGIFASHAEFHRHVADTYREVRYNLERFWYAWGHEAQEYTPPEVREVFFADIGAAG